MNGDVPIVRFAYDGGMLVFAEVIADKIYLPIEYKAKVGVLRATELFLDDRVVPPTRQHLTEELNEIGIPYYDPDALIHYNQGRSIEDNYWIKEQEIVYGEEASETGSSRGV